MKNHIDILELNNEIKRIKRQGLSADYISDGYHTFGDLYYQRMFLFSIICNQNKEKAWKSKLHHDGTMFDDYFIVGVTTSEGDYTYHYHLEHWDKFRIRELTNAPEYDGHQPEDITRLSELLKMDNDFERFEVYEDIAGTWRLRTPLAILDITKIDRIEFTHDYTFGIKSKNSRLIAVMKKTILDEENYLDIMIFDYPVEAGFIEKIIEEISFISKKILETSK